MINRARNCIKIHDREIAKLYNYIKRYFCCYPIEVEGKSIFSTK